MGTRKQSGAQGNLKKIRRYYVRGKTTRISLSVSSSNDGGPNFANLYHPGATVSTFAQSVSSSNSGPTFTQLVSSNDGGANSVRSQNSRAADRLVVVLRNIENLPAQVNIRRLILRLDIRRQSRPMGCLIRGVVLQVLPKIPENLASIFIVDWVRQVHAVPSLRRSWEWAQLAEVEGVVVFNCGGHAKPGVGKGVGEAVGLVDGLLVPEWVHAVRG